MIANRLRGIITSSFMFREAYQKYWEQRYSVRPDDWFLVSYPRSGNTWVRYMLLQAHPSYETDWDAEITTKIPDMHEPPPWYQCNRLSVVKSHLTYWQPFAKVIYLVRDGRAATYSNWRYQCDEGTYHGSLQSFVSQPHWPSTWNEHVTGWINAPQTRLIVRYEDLVADPAAALAGITAKLGWPVSLEKLDKIAANSTRSRMRNLEHSKGIRLHRVGESNRLGSAHEWTPHIDNLFMLTLTADTNQFLTNSFLN